MYDFYTSVFVQGKGWESTEHSGQTDRTSNESPVKWGNLY